MTDLSALARRYPNKPMKKPVRAYRKTVQELVKRTFALARGEQS